ncbi:MAG: bifunctional 4-hydroxy-3-methylbut-2-enyl diphosphate reductase/30S ribosomal protein S1 [Firmicutes bacterium]|nr:bifunctional 4-hydroxy-3-methylbut-2-enyl diphosphate reductase/30S ribosomal protein S1 [Bacillota bacterium]
MKIIRADPCGFCPGVKRALALAEQAMAGGTKVYTLGPLVHNEYVMTKLGSRGVEAIDRLDDIDPAALVIRAHGVSPATLTKAEALGFTIYDATCPRVRKVQQLATSLSAAAKTIILVGESEHPEVKGIVAHAQGPGKIIVVRNDKQLADLPELPQAVELLAQTTQTPANIQSVADALQNREVSVNMHDTICLATSQRQAAARELARCVDVMIVVGSNRSANTRRLAQICREEGVPTYLVSNKEELDYSWFKGKKIVGMTAGASAPEELIEEVYGRMTEEILKEEAQPTMEEEQLEAMQEAQTEEEDTTPAPSAHPAEVEQTETDSAAPEEDPQVAEDGMEADTADAKEAEQTVEELYASSLLTLQEGQVVTGKVVRVDSDGVLVDVGYKSEGLIPLAELSDLPFSRPDEITEVGEEIKVSVVKMDAEGNDLILSKRRADQEEAWDLLKEHYEKAEPIEGKVTEVVRGGLIVYLGLRAFMPASQVGLRYEADLSHYVGQTLKAKIIELEPARRRVILSHRAVLEEEREAKREALWAELEEGQIRAGKVTKLTDFGAFVDLGGAEGLVHISEMAWSRVRHPSEVVSEGEDVDVKVLRLDPERNRISLGLKQVKPDPWLEIRHNFPVGTVHEGLVTNILDFGAFVKLMDGVEGLVHISQLAPRHVGHPTEIVEIGQLVKVKVLDINEDERRISLSIKQVPPELQILTPPTEDTDNEVETVDVIEDQEADIFTDPNLDDEFEPNDNE